MSGLIPDKVKNIGDVTEDESIPHQSQKIDRKPKIGFAIIPENKVSRIVPESAYLSVVVLTLLVFIFPVGLYLIATHPRWSLGIKLFVVFGWLTLGGIGFYNDQMEKRDSGLVRSPNLMGDSVSKPKGDKADSFRSQLRTWIQERQQLSNASTKLTDGRLELVQTMRSAGKDSSSARIYAEEILELDGHIKMLGTKVQTYEAAITKAESTLRRIERRKMLKDIGVSDNELNELAETVYEWDDSLKKMTGKNVSLDLDVDDVMKSVLPIHSRSVPGWSQVRNDR